MTSTKQFRFTDKI